MFKRFIGVLAVIVLMTASFVPVSHAQSSYCYGALPTRLQVGGQGQVTPGLPNILRSQPYRGYDSVVLGEIPAGGIFTIIGGPSCYDGMYWWQVNYNGTMGWTPEGSKYGVYWTEPVTTSCMYVPSRLVIGQLGRVLPGLPNVLRSQPNRGVGSAFIANIPAGSIFTVLNGPSCSNGILWWQVNYNGLIGWTGEGQGNQYWLEPYSVVVTPTPNTCYPTQTPHMVVGYTGVVSPGLPNRLRAQPSLNGQFLANIAAGDTFTVTAGPVCGDGLTWWQVNYRGTVGWTVEGQYGRTYIDMVNCPGFMYSHISAGRPARVTPGLPNRLRAYASTASQTLTYIPGGASFDVIGGPVCAQNAAWWQVNFQGVIGWTMEGQYSQYWLEP